MGFLIVSQQPYPGQAVDSGPPDVLLLAVSPLIYFPGHLCILRLYLGKMGFQKKYWLLKDTLGLLINKRPPFVVITRLPSQRPIRKGPKLPIPSVR